MSWARQPSCVGLAHNRWFVNSLLGGCSKGCRLVEDLIRELLTSVGEDPNREGLLKTPGRVKRALGFLTEGYRQDPAALIRDAVFTDKYEEMVVVKNIPLYSLCEHHLLPFFGEAHVAYLPKGRLVGISKIARMVDLYARRLQVQERLTQQTAETLHEILHPYGVGVVIEAQHLCMQMRGVQKSGTTVTTSAMLGAFRENLSTREEFLTLIKR
ncbi:MAG: GTP cyclohydrolase I FolE [Deltaproteobacteria bacterium]|nr:GTP cyclohydrolase I FolE [Deltaproteobacteria bacterium]